MWLDVGNSGRTLVVFGAAPNLLSPMLHSTGEKTWRLAYNGILNMGLGLIEELTGGAVFTANVSCYLDS